MNVLEAAGIGARLGRKQVLEGVDLVVREGGWTAVVGPNGAGKSTLLRVVAALIGFDGTVRLDGADVSGMAARERARLIGYAPQLPVMPEGLPIRDYVMLGRTPHRPLLAAPRAADREEVERALERLDLVALADRTPRTLSGGERQRVVLARVLAQRPRLVLLDEPTSALDLGHAQQVLELIDRLRREEGLTVLSTLHDLVLAGQYADHLVLLNRGRVVADGTPAEVLTRTNLAVHYGADAEVSLGSDGVRVHPVRPVREPG